MTDSRLEDSIEALNLINPTADSIHEFVDAVEMSGADPATKAMANDLARYFDEVTMELADDLGVEDRRPSE